MASSTSPFEDASSDLTSQTPALILDEALTHLATAIAALHRAGPLYAAHSEPFWHFAAGTWSPDYYQCRVEEASKKLPKRICVKQDVTTGIEELKEAVALLCEFGDRRDADDLEEAVEAFLLNVGEDL